MAEMIRSLANSKVKRVRRLQSDRRTRQREQAFVVEGDRWLAELIQMSVPPQLLFYTPAWAETAVHQEILHHIEAVGQSSSLLVTEEVMAAMSDTTTPPGILAVVSIQPQPLPDSPTLLLILDRINTPGNLGTMLRTAGAAGVEGVLLGPGCVDAYNPKVIRGSMGAHLRLPVHHLAWDEISEIAEGMAVWVATVEGDVTYTAVNWRNPSALIIGSEASGPGEKALTLASKRVTIPMHAATESLNAAVAAGVILFEAARQRRLV